MKLAEVFRFELRYQLGRPWVWLAFAILVVFAFQNTRVGILPVTLPQDFILNSPFIVASVSVISCLIWLLVASPIAGEAAARDVYTGMHPLTYTSPVSKLEYLGGRFIAAFALNALVLMGVQVGNVLAIYAGGIDPSIIGPFRPASYLAAYAFIGLTNAFVATSFQFIISLLSGRSLASYFASILLFFFTFPVPLIVYFALGQPEVALMLDPIGMLAIMNEMMLKWTIVEKNVRMFTLEGPMLYNRLLWLGIASLMLATTYVWFQFSHRTVSSPLRWLTNRVSRRSAPLDVTSIRSSADILIPASVQHHGFRTQIIQVLTIARTSLSALFFSAAGIFLLIVFPAFVALVVVTQSEHWGITLEPWTGYILAKHITAPLTHMSDYRVIVPLLIVFLSGELIWRERDAKLSETIDTTPVPGGVILAGKLMGLVLLMTILMIGLTCAGMIAQSIMGYDHYQPGLYLTILIGLQLPEYLIFVVLAFVVQILVNQKHIGMLVALLLYLLIVCASLLGVHHNLLIYGGSPAWTYTEIRGFGSSLMPWMWFKSYWTAWAVFFVVIGSLLWVRGRETSIRSRVRQAQLSFTPVLQILLFCLTTCIVALFTYIFYNTNVINEYITDEELVRRRAEYEKQYGKYEGIPQPSRKTTKVEIEIYPQEGRATVHGSYLLINLEQVPINTVHVEPAFYVSTKVTFDKNVQPFVKDDRLGHHIYKLEAPLNPGDSMTLSFDVTFDQRGFTNSGTATAILANGTHFTGGALPLIGYQPRRELWGADERKKYGLPRQLTLVSLSDVDPTLAATPAATFEAIIGTEEDQIAVAPGNLKRTWWGKEGRRHFHFVTDAPIVGEYMFFSSQYHLHQEQWNGVDIQIYNDPAHIRNGDRVLQAAKAGLDYYSSQFGPYPYKFLQIVEQPGNFLGMGVDGSGVITAGEGIFRLDPKGKSFDAIFEIVAHEIGHQWWGVQLKPAFAEGGGVISESLAWYSAMQLVKKEKGREALRKLMSFMREPNPWPAIKTGLPLLRAMDPWANYRKGPYAMHALSEYVGEQKINQALKTLIEKKTFTLATTTDLYRELQVQTPDTLKALLHDLFEVNAFWKFDTKNATAHQSADGRWQVTFEVEAQKMIADSAGVEKAVAIGEWVEVGVFAPAAPGETLGKTLYLKKYFIEGRRQTIQIMVSEKPARGGIDPYNLLDWEEGDNIEPITF